MSHHHNHVTTDKLLDDMRLVLEDAEALLQATAGQVGDTVQEARARAEQTVRAARARLADAQDELTRRARDAAEEADRYVRDNPWTAIGVAAGIAFIVGVLVSRR
jgi:ElaB/YqjD/DUF883 family membrane-anchored ribosome-binding protein